MALATRNTENGPVAVLHHVEGAWRALIVGASTADAGRLRVLNAEEFADAQAETGLDPWLEQYDVTRVISVLPASSVICRTVTLPNAPEEQLDQALRLQAESHLLGVASPHRTAMAVLPIAAGENARAGLIVAWPENAQAPQPPTEYSVTYVADVAALAGLIGAQRPPQPALWLDRRRASIAVALSHANGMVYRATRESSENDTEWRDRIANILGETAVNVGHSAGFVQSMVEQTRQQLAQHEVSGSALLLPDEVVQNAAERFEGVTPDQTWWSTYGVAAGAALSAHSALDGLTRIVAEQPSEDPSSFETIVNRLAQPRTAAKVLVVCALLLAITPLAFSGLRLQLLKWRFGDVDETLSQVERARSTLAIYSHFENNTWPMTKLLADIACNTPDGIEINALRLNQQNGNIRIDGRAKPHGNDQSAKDVVALMQRRLADTYIFNNIELDWQDPNAYGIYQFSLSARVARPHRQYEYPDELDYGRYTVADRRDGNEPRSREQIVELMTTADRGLRTPDRPLLDGTAVASAGRRSSSASGRGTSSPGGWDDGDRRERESASSRGIQRPQQTAGPAERENEADRDSAPDERQRRAQAGREQEARGEQEENGGSGRASRQRRTRDEPRRGERPGQRSEERGASSGVPDRLVVPDPITQEEVDQMNRSQVLDQLTKVTRAKQHNSADEELVERLNKERKMLMERLRELPR